MKNIKKIIGSALLATAFAVTSVGTTFALFTDEAKTTITVGSGIVNIESGASLVRYKSTVEGGEGVDLSSLSTYTNPLVGNEFSLSGSVVTINKMVPGDQLTVKLSALNKSNVRTKTRFLIEHALITGKEDLYPALELSFALSDSSSPASLFKWKSNDPVDTDHMAEGVELYKDLLVTITLPDSHNGALTFGSENLDNQYQDKGCSISFTLQAVQGNASTNPIDEINAYLQAEKIVEGQNKTMHDAVIDMGELGFNNLSILSGYVYDLANDQFVTESSVSANYHRYFKVYSEIPTPSQTFSIYAANNFSVNEGAVALNGVGFDAGDATGIASVSYAGLGQENARSNIIRTNSLATSVTINAEYDVVEHYGESGYVNVIAVATNSYHEFGTVAFAEITSGRIAIEKGGKVSNLHIASIKDTNNQTTNEFAEIIVSIGEDVEKPTFSRDDVEIASAGTLVVALQEGTETISEDTQLDYVWLTKQGIFEQIKISDNAESMENAKWADDESLEDTNAQEVAQEIANNIARNNTTSQVEAVVEIDNTEYVVTLDQETRELVVTQDEQVVEDTDIIQGVVDEGVKQTGLTQEEKETQKEEIVNEAKYKDFIDAGYSLVVGNKGYTNIKEAFEEVEDNQKIVLIKNVSLILTPEDVNEEGINYFQGSGFSTNYKMYSYIHLHNKNGIKFDLNKNTLNVDYSFNLVDHFPSGYSYAAKAFIYLSGEGSLDIYNGTMNVRFDYKNRAATSTGSSVHNTGKYAAVYVHTSPASSAAYDVPYETKLSMVNCNLTSNQIPLYLGHGARVTELNANLKYLVGSTEETVEGKDVNINPWNIQGNTDQNCCVFADAGSKIDLISGGSYIARDQRLFDYVAGLNDYLFQDSNLFAIRVAAGFKPTYIPTVEVPQAVVEEIRGGDFQSNSLASICWIYGRINKISGGIFRYIEGTFINRNNMYINAPLRFDKAECLGTISGGTFVSGCSTSRPNPLDNVIRTGNAVYPNLSTIIAEGYEAVANHDFDYTFNGGTVGEQTFYGYTVRPIVA